MFTGRFDPTLFAGYSFLMHSEARFIQMAAIAASADRIYSSGQLRLSNSYSVVVLSFRGSKAKVFNRIRTARPIYHQGREQNDLWF